MIVDLGKYEENLAAGQRALDPQTPTASRRLGARRSKIRALYSNRVQHAGRVTRVVCPPRQLQRIVQLCRPGHRPRSD